MVRSREEDEEEAGESQDPECPDDCDMDGDVGEEAEETLLCPHCRRDVYEAADLCPQCGSFISAEDMLKGRPTWIVVGLVIATIGAVVIAFARFW